MSITLSYFSSYCSKFILFDKEGDCRSELPWTEKARAVISLQRIHGESTCQSDERFCHWKALDGFADIHYRGNSLRLPMEIFFLLSSSLPTFVLDYLPFRCESCRCVWMCLDINWNGRKGKRAKERKSGIRMSRKELNMTTLSTAYH